MNLFLIERVKMEVRKSYGKKRSVFSVPVSFDGGLQSLVRAEVINELLKYLLYERQQIPLPVDAIKLDVNQLNSNPAPKKTVCTRMHMRKAIDFLAKFEESMSKMIQAFEVFPEIKKVAVAMGATPLSPKEVYVIHLPPLNPEAENLPTKACVKTLFRQLISQDPLRNLKQIPPTNIRVLIQAPRSSDFTWFLPKPTYQLPVKGNHFEFQLLSKYGQGRHDLSKDFSVVELSGFEPFDLSIDDISLTSCKSPSVGCESQSSEESVTADYVCVEAVNNLELVPDSQTLESQNQDSVANQLQENQESSAPGGNNFKRLKKSTSASSILSQTSMIAQSQRSLTAQEDMEFEDIDTGIFSFTDPDYIWFQSPVTIKGYRMSKKP